MPLAQFPLQLEARVNSLFTLWQNPELPGVRFRVRVCFHAAARRSNVYLNLMAKAMPMRWWERALFVLALAALMGLALVILLEFPVH